MKKIFLVSLISFFTISSETVLAASNFDGIYVGGAFGRARAIDKAKEYKDNGNNYYGATQKTVPEGNLFAAFVGANKVLKENILLGAEVDFEKRDHSHASFQEEYGSVSGLYPIETKIKNAASIRAKFGYVFNNDKSLAYLMGGRSTIKAQRTYGELTNSRGHGTSHTVNTRHNGYVMGLGLEHFITKKISLRAEYRYVRYAAKNIDTTFIYDPGTLERQKLTDQSARIGFAYNF